MSKRLLTVLGSTIKPVSVPDAAFSYVPFSIYKGNIGGFTITPSFDLQTYANIPNLKTYYVSTTGNDSNTGLDWDNAFRTVTKALSNNSYDVDKTYVAAGYYFRNQSGAGINPQKSMQIIGIGNVYLTPDCRNEVGAFSLVDNHYEASVSRNIMDVWDASVPDGYSEDVRLTKKTSIAEVDATPGSWFNDTTADIVYIKTLDSREPDENIRYYEGLNPIDFIADNRVLYLENINYMGGLSTAKWQNNSATGGTKVYAKDCTFKYSYSGDVVDIDGLSECILQNCTASKSITADGFSYHAKNGVVVNAIEIDCEAYDCGDATTDQGSTMHDAGNIVRVNGEYHHTRGQCIADVGASQAWLLGTYMHDAESTGANDDGYYLGNAGANAWLDECTISVDGYDLVTETDTNIYVRNLTSGGSNNIGGTLAAY